jgi:hypothetical protein
VRFMSICPAGVARTGHRTKARNMFLHPPRRFFSQGRHGGALPAVR